MYTCTSGEKYFESRSGERPNYVFAIFAKKMVRVPPKTASRRPNPENLARPEGQGPEDRKPKAELRFCYFRQKNGPGTSEDRKPKAESRKLGPARPEGQGPEDRKPNYVFAIFAKKWSGYLRRPRAEGRIPKAWPGPRGRGPKTENRITFLPFSPKKWSGYLRRPKAEGRIPKAWPGPRAGARRPKTESRITLLPFSPKKWSGHLRRPKAEGRIPKAWPGPARGAGARRPNTENRFGNFRKKMVRVLPKTESRRPNPESLARPEGQGPEDRKPNYVFAIFAKKRSGYLRRPQAEGRIPKAWPGPRGRGPKTEPVLVLDRGFH